MDPEPAALLPNKTAGPTNTNTSKPKTGAAAAEPRKVVRRRKKKDGPKYPQSGYIRFMHVRREELRKLQPEATTIDITKIIGAEWNVLAEDVKQPYLVAAKIDFDRYNQECVDYKKTLSERAAAESDAETVVPIKKEPKPKEPKSLSAVPKSGPKKPPSPLPVQPPRPEPVISNTESTAAPAPPQPPKLAQRTGNYDIPIFTEDFLDHNKVVDYELRMLRKSNTDYEQQNSVLERHVENMSNGIDKQKSANADLERTNDALQAYLDGLQAKLVAALGAPIPGHAEGATVSNLGEYMAALATSTAPGALNKARDGLRKLDV